MSRVVRIARRRTGRPGHQRHHRGRRPAWWLRAAAPRRAGATRPTGSTDEILVGERRRPTRPGSPSATACRVTALPCLECDETSIGEATVVGIVRLTEDLVDDPAPQLTILAGPTLVDGRWREAEQPGTILSLHVADGVDRPTLTADLSTHVGSLGNVSDQEVDTETVQRAAAFQRERALPPRRRRRRRGRGRRRPGASPATCSGVPATHPPSRPSGSDRRRRTRRWR